MSKQIEKQIQMNYTLAPEIIASRPQIEHIREFRHTRKRHSADHFCIGYIFSGHCRINTPYGVDEISARHTYIIGRGDHIIECIPNELGVFEQIVVHLCSDSLSNYSKNLSLSDRELLRFENAVVMGLASNISIEELADRCCISLSTFKRRFSMRYNQPPHRWFTEQRLALTHEAILTTSLPLCDIVEASGFINSSHFISLFRRYYGITPARLRRQLRHR